MAGRFTAFKRSQLNRVVQVLTEHCNLQRHKKNTDRAESCKLYQDICVKYFGITKTTVHDVVTKCNANKLATYLEEAVGFLSSTSNQTKLWQRSKYGCYGPK